jgi:hypothetical protein
MSYTNRFTETATWLGGIFPASYTAEQETGWIDLALYHRAVVIFVGGALGCDVYVDVHEATDTSGSNVDEYDDSAQDLEIDSLDDNGVSMIEIRPEVLTPNHHHCIKVLVSGNGQTANVYAVGVLGFEPRFAAVSAASIDQIND